MQGKLPKMPQKRNLHIIKNIFVAGFIAGLAIFFFLGKEFVEDTGLLDSYSLIEIRDSSIDKATFFVYLFWRRMLLLGIGVLFWWWGFSRLYLYGMIGCSGIIMGACLYISLLRYPLTGLFLWFFLYFPHMIFYAGVVLCGMILAVGKFQKKEEKMKFVWQNAPVVLLLLALFVLAIYSESYWNVSLLRMFLEYF